MNSVKFSVTFLLMIIAIQIKAQNNKYEIDSDVYTDGKLYDPQSDLIINKKTKFEIKPISEYSNDVSIKVILVKGKRIISKRNFETYLEFNKNFNDSFLKKLKQGRRLYFCFVNRNVSKHNILKFDKEQYSFDKVIMIPLKE